MSGMMGQRILRVEDDRFLRGKGLYVENLEVENALHATFVRSPVAHARIAGIDTSAVATVPGAQVFTAADVELQVFPPPPIPGINDKMVRPFLARDVVRFVGDIVAATSSASSATSSPSCSPRTVRTAPTPPSS